MSSIFVRVADDIDDLATAFEGIALGGAILPPAATASYAAGLRNLAEALRIGDRVRIVELMRTATVPQYGGVTVLPRLTVVPGGRA